MTSPAKAARANGRERVARHHWTKHPRPSELLDARLLPFAWRHSRRAVVGVGAVGPDVEWHVRLRRLGVNRSRRHRHRPRPHLTVRCRATTQEQRAGPRHHPAVLHHRSVDEFHPPALALNRYLDRHRLDGHRAQQVNGQPSGLKVVAAMTIQCPAQQAADDLTAHRRAPGSTGHRSRHIAAAVGGEERVHPLMLGSGEFVCGVRSPISAGGGIRTLTLSRAPAPKAGMSAIPSRPRAPRAYRFAHR